MQTSPPRRRPRLDGFQADMEDLQMDAGESVTFSVDPKSLVGHFDCFRGLRLPVTAALHPYWDHPAKI
jgi:hypothetical protein